MINQNSANHKAEYGLSPLQPLASDAAFFQELQDWWLKTLALAFGVEPEAMKPAKHHTIFLSGADLRNIK